MPIYEYGCRSCGHTLDALQKLDDKPLRKCPECGRSTLKRLVSAPAFRLKGGGWYETDFKSDGEKKRNLAESGREKAKDEAKTMAAGAAGEGKQAPSKPKDDTAKPKRAAKVAGKSAGEAA